MRKLQITIFVIAMLILTTQIIRHLYVKYYYKETSVLDKYLKDETDKHIEEAESKDKLLEKYNIAFNKVKNFEKGKNKNDLYKYRSDEPYKSKNKYEEAIRDWENKEIKIREVWIFWFAGFLLILIGSLLYFKKLNWIGISLIVSGFIEMMWWSSPSLSFDGARLEFVKLLNTKILFSIITYILLLAYGILIEKYLNKSNV